MPIIRTQKDHERGRYRQIDIEPAQDGRLSWGARGMLFYLLSKPDDWRVIVSNLVNESSAGRHKVYGFLKELEGAGYILRYQPRDEETGFFGPHECYVFENPAMNPNNNQPLPKNWNADNQPLPNLPEAAEPHTDEPHTVKQPLQIKDSTNKRIDKKKSSSSNTTTTTLPLNVISTFEEEMGGVTPYRAKQLKKLVDEIGDQWVIDAIQEASVSGVPKLTYVKAILERWKREGRGRKENGVGDWQLFIAWHSGKRPFQELPAPVQEKIRTLGGDGIRKQPARFFKREFEGRVHPGYEPDENGLY